MPVNAESLTVRDGRITKRQPIGEFWLLRHGYMYLHETQLCGLSTWGNRQDAKHYSEWAARKILSKLRQGDGMMRSPITGIKLVHVRAYACKR